MRVALLVSSEVATAVELARDWAAAGEDVTVVLLDAAVARARAGHRGAGEVARLPSAGIRVLAHDAALGRRGIGAPALADGVKVCDLDEIADLVAETADRAVWL